MEVTGQHSGFCFGGPANSLRISTNGELGFLWVDTTLSMLWIYNWNSVRHIYVVQDENGQPIVPDENPDDGIQYGVENEDKYAVILHQSRPPTE